MTPKDLKVTITAVPVDVPPMTLEEAQELAAKTHSFDERMRLALVWALENDDLSTADGFGRALRRVHGHVRGWGESLEYSEWVDRWASGKTTDDDRSALAAEYRDALARARGATAPGEGS